MITASHNPQCDNGVKLIDPQGEMLEASWEGLATKLANAPNNQDVCSQLINIASEYDISSSYTPSVFIGRDTRQVEFLLRYWFNNTKDICTDCVNSILHIAYNNYIHVF